MCISSVHQINESSNEFSLSNSDLECERGQGYSTTTSIVIVVGVLNWLAPKTVRDVRKFLGLANYYRRFVKDFAKIARPLNNLTRKEEKWKWGDEQQGAFKQLKQVFTSRLLLVAPDINKEFRVEANASNFATGGVLSVKCEDGKWRPVAYISKLLNKMEQNYEIHDKQMLAVICCLEAWRHFLEGSQSKF